MQSMGRDPHLLASRLKQFLAPVPAKDLARKVGCDLRTAENIRAGHWPIARHWLGLLAAFGEDLTEAVFHPEKAAQRLELEVHSLEQQLAEKRANLRDLSGARPGGSQGLAALEDRTAPQ